MKGVQGAVAFEDMQAFPSGCGEASGNAFCPWESAPYGRALGETLFEQRPCREMKKNLV